MKVLTTKQIVFRIIVIMGVIEYFIMLTLWSLPNNGNSFVEAFVDTVFLALLSAPIIYLWVIKPFVKARDDALAHIGQLAFTDSLTMLANRRLISQHLGKIIASCIRHENYGAVLLIDLDGFKFVNDDHGHKVGDAVLIEMAARLRSSVRSEDVGGRLGGDEFVVLIPRLGVDRQKAQEKALRVAEKIINAFKKPINFNGKVLSVGASAGVRLLGFETQDIDVVISEADTAMYRAKQAGKGCAFLFESK